MSQNFIVSRLVLLRPKRHTMVMVSIEHLGFMSIHPNEELHAKHNIVSINGIVEVRPNVAFKLIVANYGGGEYFHAKNQILENFLTYGGSLVPTSISLIEVLGLTEETSLSKDVTVKSRQHTTRFS